MLNASMWEKCIDAYSCLRAAIELGCGASKVVKAVIWGTMSSSHGSDQPEVSLPGADNTSSPNIPCYFGDTGDMCGARPARCW